MTIKQDLKEIHEKLIAINNRLRDEGIGFYDFEKVEMEIFNGGLLVKLSGLQREVGYCLKALKKMESK